MPSIDDILNTFRADFAFLKGEFGFEEREQRITNFCGGIEYRAKDKVVSVSYDQRQDHLDVRVLRLDRGRMPDFDDARFVDSLSKLSERILPSLSRDDREQNAKAFPGRQDPEQGKADEIEDHVVLRQHAQPRAQPRDAPPDEPSRCDRLPGDGKRGRPEQGV